MGTNIKGECCLCGRQSDFFVERSVYLKGEKKTTVFCVKCESLTKLAECLCIEKKDPVYFEKLKHYAKKMMDELSGCLTVDKINNNGEII